MTRRKAKPIRPEGEAMGPEKAATLAIERLTEMGIQVDLQSASARQIRLRVVAGNIAVPLGNDVWAAREGLPAWVQGIPIRYEEEGGLTNQDQQVMTLDAEQWDSFLAALDAPVQDLPQLRALLSEQGFFDTLAQCRLQTMAVVMETPLKDLEGFLDFLGEEPLTRTRITGAQYVMGLPTPVLSHLQFPEMEPPTFGRELLAEWLRRQSPDDAVKPVALSESDSLEPEPNDFSCATHAVYGSEWPWPNSCVFCEYDRELQRMAECLEVIARAAKRHLADPADPAWRDRLSTATADAFAVLYDAPRPRRAITVEELVASGLTVKVGTDPSEAAIPWYNRHPRLGEIVQTLTPAEETRDILYDEAFPQSLAKYIQQEKEGETRSLADVRRSLGIPPNKAKKGRDKR